MENTYRTRCVLLGLLCLMPALFFWALRSLPLEWMATQPLIYFSGATKLQFIIYAFVFPILAVGLGWNAYHRCESKSESLLVILVGILEIAAATAAAIFGFGFLPT